MATLPILFFIVALLYSMVGFGGGSSINYPTASYLAALDFATRSGVLHCQSKRLGIWTTNLRSKLQGIEPQEIKLNNSTLELNQVFGFWPAFIAVFIGG